MAEQLTIAPGTELELVEHNDALLELCASYTGGGAAPPAHWHPHQDEHFEVLAGAMRAELDGTATEIGLGDQLDVPRGTVHRMWNARAEPALLRWQTTPAGRTLEWFRELAALYRGEPAGDPATLLERFRDVIRLGDPSQER
jgi:mannose-6-phosphate isomerase-like protein (cupin superfamily)